MPGLKRRSSIWRLLKTAVAIGLIAFLGYSAGLGELADLSHGFSAYWLALAIALVAPSILVRAYNYSLLLNREGVTIPLGEMTRLTLVGVGLGLFIPTGASDLAKAHYAYRLHGHPEAMVISSVLDKITSLTAVAVMGTVGAVISDAPVIVAFGIALAVASMVPLAFPGRMPWQPLIRVLAPSATIDVKRLAASARAPIRLLLGVYAVSLFGWILTYGVVFACCRAVGADISFALVLAIAPLASLARFIPISAGGIGLGELTMTAMFVNAGVPERLAALAPLLSVTLTVLLPGSLGLILFAVGTRASNARS